MGQRFFLFLTEVLCVSASLLQAQRPAKAPVQKPCGLSFEGEVSEGKSFIHAGPVGQDFMLEAIPSGWIVRMLAHGQKRGSYDYAGLATPPYKSPNPILISTDFAFRAQDAIGWNPRRFAYFRSAAQMNAASDMYERNSRDPHDVASLTKLVQMTSQAQPAELAILDAHLVGGTRDQNAAAAAVAAHFTTTAHMVELGPGTPLGRITWLRFRVHFPVVSGQNTAPCVLSR